MISRKECETLLGVAVQAPGVDEVFAVLNATDSTSRSIAGRVMLEPQRVRNISLTVTVRTGKRFAQASGNIYNEANVKELLARAAKLAVQMPEAPLAPPFPGPVEVEEASMFHERSGSDEWSVLNEGFASYSLYTKFAKTRMFGNMTSAETVVAIASSNGLFLYQPSSLVHLRVRGYAADGSSSGFAEQYTIDRSSINATAILRNAAENCITWDKPIEFEPRRVTTILDPRAFADMLLPMLGQFSRRAVEQDQSFLRRLDGTSFLGRKLFSEQVTLRSNPYDTRFPSIPFTTDGQPIKAETWVDKGVISQLIVDRYDAAEHGLQGVAPPSNLSMDVDTPVQDLVADTEYGLLVKGFSNLNILDPKNCLLTGSTRDGVYLIEKGQITKAVRNLIIRETPVYLFKELEAIGRSELTSTTSNYFPMMLPPIRVNDVMFTQQSGLI